MAANFRSLLRSATTAAVFLAVSSAAYAIPVSFTTTGMFSVAGGGASLTFDGITGGEGDVDVNPFTFASLGEIVNTAGSTTLDSVAGTLTITITQSTPGALASDTIVGTLSGSVSSNQSTATIDFGGLQTVTLNGVQYQLQQSTYVLVPTDTNQGATSIQARIDASNAIPEPASMALIGGGLALLGFVGRRRNIA